MQIAGRVSFFNKGAQGLRAPDANCADSIERRTEQKKKRRKECGKLYRSMFRV